MENASKALLMAAGVLIALIIIGALILMFSNLTNYQNTKIQTTREAQVVEFNNQYETYNRNNVRGSELYSLLNRVIDYNRRKSTKGTGTKDEGKTLQYMPMTVIVKLKDDLNEFYYIKTTDNQYTNFEHLINKNEYEASETNNKFKEDIKETVDDLEKRYGTDVITNLVTGMTKIFIDDNSTEEEKLMAVKSGGLIYDKIKKWDNIKKGSKIRNDVYKYYEYIQFKRARFDCKSSKYDENTGRITNLEFEFNGKFE